jgi:hypothetical protein
MKTLTTLTAVVALIAGITVASAASPMDQGATSKGGAATQNQNATTSKMGKSDTMGGKKVIGNSQFCAQNAGQMKCTYTSMAKCNSANQANGWSCVPNPSATTGAK